MEKGTAEREFAALMGRLNIWCHKWADRRICEYCGRLLYKVDSNVDYTIILPSARATLVEVKQADESWNSADEESGIRPNQRRLLTEWQEKYRISTWLYLALGSGRAPHGRSSYLVPWTSWCELEAQLLNGRIKSISKEGGKFVPAADWWLAEWRLEWNRGGWIIPPAHVFWQEGG